ncbi:MAG: CvpA family protein [Chloroflexi bacterium]|nr:CvpA family protein [Chloroflexota bacterium]
MPYTFMDVVLVGVFLLGIFAGTGQGMVRQVFSLLGLILGVVLASRYYLALSDYLSWVGSPDGAKLLTFVVITLALLAVGNYVGALVHRALGYMKLGCVDWLGGGVIGAVETLFFVDIALILALRYPVLGLPQIIQEARIPPIVFKLAPALLAFLPPEFDTVKKFLQQ